MSLPTVVYLGPAAACVLAWLGIGAAIPGRLLPSDRLLAGLTRVGAGSVVTSLGVLALGRVGLLERLLLLGLTLALALPGIVAARRLSRGQRASRLSRVQTVLLGAVAVALALDLVSATAPITSADALRYHLALPKLWLQLGHVGDPFWQWQGFDPSGIEMLYTQGLALGGASSAAALHAFFAAGCAAAVFGFGRSLFSSALAGAAAAFLFVLQGVVTWEATSAFIELGLAFYATLAVWHLWRWWVAPSVPGALWTGVFAGATAGTKYLGLAVAAIVLLACAVRSLQIARRDLLVACAGAALAGGWWYLRNALDTGNPFYPLLFGGKWLTPFANDEIHAAYAQYGLGGGAARLVLLPVDLLVHGGAFDRGRYVGTAIFVFAIVALVVARRRAVLGLWAGVVVFLVAWHAESQQARFLLPALAILATIGGGGVAVLWEAAGSMRVAAVIVLALAAGAWLVSSVALTRQLLPVAVGAQSHAAFLQRLTGTYDAFVAARRAAEPGTVGLAGYTFTFNFPGRAVSIDVPEFVPSIDRTTYLARLRSLGVRSILVGGGLAGNPELRPIRSCLRLRATYRARFVTSRSLGRSVPYELALYSLAGCAA